MKRSHHLVICLALALGLAPAGCGLDPNAPQDPDQPSTSLGTGLSAGDTNTTNDTNSANAVEACQELEDTLAACQPILAGTLQCSSYDGWPCDLTAYFDCVTDAYGMCSGGTFPDIDALGLQDCAMLTVCN